MRAGGSNPRPYGFWKPGQVPEAEEFRGSDMIRRYIYSLAEPLEVFSVSADYVVGLPAPGMVVFMYGDVASFCPCYCVGDVLESEHLDIKILFQGF